MTTDNLPHAVQSEIPDEAGTQPSVAALRSEKLQLEQEMARSEENAPEKER